MRLEDLDFTYPSELIAVEPSRPTRVAYSALGADPVELSMAELLDKFEPGDLLVLNESKVIPARVFSTNNDEILFLRQLSPRSWEVLFPSKPFKVGDTFTLPGGVTATLVLKALPQVLNIDAPLDNDYFEVFGEMALPPYIQEARDERHNRAQDKNWYQPKWAAIAGSVAAPTASLHFSESHLAELAKKNVEIGKLILHVGAGTFMPIRHAEIDNHEMHAETVEIPNELIDKIEKARAQGKRVWALGTTVTRSLESLAQGQLEKTATGFKGATKLFIRPGHKFEMVDMLMTNFHQPRSTLLCLVAAFAGLDKVKSVYQWAIGREFKLFSYGDLSVWSNK